MPDEATPADDQPWYVAAFDRGYAERYSHRDDAEASRQIDLFVREGFIRPGQQVLDLCCGAGRHCALLAGRGARPIGVDLSADLLRSAPTPGGRRLALARGDMRTLPFRAGSFDATIQMFTAFGYFRDDADNHMVLDEVRRVLRDGARYVLDLINKRRTVANLVPSSIDTRDDGSVIEQFRSFDPKRSRIDKRIVVRATDGSEQHRQESVRVFELEEIRDWLAQAGLELDLALGDFDAGPFDSDSSERMILVSVAR